MRVRRRSRHLDDFGVADLAPAAPTAARNRTSEVLRLQREVGNKAVTDLVLQRDEGAITQTMLIDSLDIVLPVFSWSISGGSRVGPGRGGQAKSEPQQLDVPVP